jgi:hypothetical protein
MERLSKQVAWGKAKFVVTTRGKEEEEEEEAMDLI